MVNASPSRKSTFNLFSSINVERARRHIGKPIININPSDKIGPALNPINNVIVDSVRECRGFKLLIDGKSKENLEVCICSSKPQNPKTPKPQ